MIILDTNVVSELSRPKVSEVVLRWFDAQPLPSIYFTAISLAEVLAGLSTMPEGKRKSLLTKDMQKLIGGLFGPRILPFDESAAQAYAEIARSCFAKGRPLPQSDAQIAAIAKANGFAVATRDVKPFEAAGVDVINPWA